MATYYINRSEYPVLTNKELKAKIDAFHTLYCGGSSNAKMSVTIDGQWPEMYRGEGLYLKNNRNAEIIHIGRKYVTIRFTDYSGHWKTEQVMLCEKEWSGFSEIMLITVR